MGRSGLSVGGSLYPPALVLGMVLALAFTHAGRAQPLVPPKEAPPKKRSEQWQVQKLLHGPDLEGKDGPFAKVGKRLAVLYHRFTMAKTEDERQSVGKDGPTNVFQGRVAVDAIASESSATLFEDLKALGLRHGARAGRLVSGQLPIEALPDAAQRSTLQFLRASLARRSVGDVTTEGDVAMHADDARDAENVDGTGMTVGVISDTYNQTIDPGFDDADDDIDSGDLPASRKIQILDDPSVGNPKDEGRAMMQVIRDVAPNARQAFHSGFPGRASMVEAIRRLADAGCDVLVDDLRFAGQPFFQDGPVAQVADSVVAEGIPFFSAAGNEGQQSYSSVFRDVEVGEEDRIFHDFHPGEGAPDVYQALHLPVGQSVLINLQWTDPYASAGRTGADSDLDVYFVNDTLGVEQVSRAPNVRNDPIEVPLFENDGTVDANRDGEADTVFFLAIELVEGSVPERIKYIYGDSADILEYDTKSPTSYGHPNAEKVAAVGAASFRETPAYGTRPPEVEPFSSEGGVPIYFNRDGGRLITPEVRARPDFVAPDQADNTFFGTEDVDEDGFLNFAGTSAAAPHAAGVAALMLDKNPGLDPPEIYSNLEESAIDMDDPATQSFNEGFDARTGHGLIQADQALQAVQAQTRLYVDAGASGSNDGSSWPDAYRHLQDAFDEANQHPSLHYEIWVAQGRHYPDRDAIDHTGDGALDHVVGDRTESFTLVRDSVHVYGGFEGNETERSQRIPEVNNVILSGEIANVARTSDNSYHVLYLDGRSGETITDATVLDGMTVTKGQAREPYPDDEGGGLSFPDNSGGGLFCDGGGPGNACNPTLTDLVFRDNAAVFGGGLFVNNSATTAKASLAGAETGDTNRRLGSRERAVSGATGPAPTGTSDATQKSGAPAKRSASSPKSFSTLVLTNSTFRRNVADERGGAIYNSGRGSRSSPLIRETIFADNESTDGGALYNDGTNGTANPTIVGVEFRRNVASWRGGAMYSDGGEGGEASPVLLNSRVASNTATDGGAFYFDGTDGTTSPVIGSTVLVGNVADTSGGGMYNRGMGGGASPSIINVTVAGNAAHFGGALYNDARNGGTASPAIKNTILWANTAPNGSQVFNDAPGATPQVRFSILENGQDGIRENDGSSTRYDGESTLEASPQFATGAGPDGRWGTDDDDLRLQGPRSGGGPSPGIDAGLNAALDFDGDGSSEITSDLAGEERRQEVDEAAGAGSGSPPLVDIGAYESSGAPLPVELARFDATVNDRGVTLTWKTASETDNAGFAVQRRHAASDWTQVGFVKGAGTTGTPQSYRFVDADLPYASDSLRYRLKQIDADGSASFSRAIAVRVGPPEQLELQAPFPNPASTEATIRYAVPEGAEDHPFKLVLYDVLGRTVRTIASGPRVGRNETTLRTADLSSGTYFLHLRVGDRSETDRLIVIR